ncbi:hypothetical protein BZA05DRAFT_412380 [Tricharina praecox]|uniref:uncharacterized protein n=1 Tax=Tricharina praecox TaxID=43433 RepID=UPI00221F81E5|nr:uncharacterized protein BZA05DRAFT_412380 [Tricharina praecox]KAI5842337.1 hypothetical protein BZA05DRAFT_412380 [Tricharina praecox]
MKSIPTFVRAAVALVAAAALLPHVSAQGSSDPCTDASVEIERSMLRRRNFELPASVAVACMKTFTLSPDRQLNLTRHVRKYMDFYSAGTYFQHNVCPELDLPTVNINATFDRIEKDIQAGKLTTYDVNRQLFELFGSVKDGHVQFLPTCVAGAFVFIHDYPLMQFAATPDSIPETYHAIFRSASQPPTVGQKVVKINGIDPVTYLTDLAKNHPESAWIDPDARFNELLINMRRSQWQNGHFAQRQSYEENPISIEFANGTTVQVEWKARYLNGRRDATEVPLPFTDSDTFGAYVCTRTDQELIADLGALLSGSVDGRGPEDAPPIGRDSDDGNGSIRAPLYPRQNSQPTWFSENIIFGTDDGEISYYELDNRTAVLTLTAFTEIPGSVSSNQFQSRFSEAAASMIAMAKKNGITRLLIDITSNGGGYTSLGFNLARQLFPQNSKIFFGNNMRWHPLLDKVFTEGDQDYLLTTYFALGQLHTPEGGDWKDWRDMLGPVHRDDDLFTKISIPDESQIVQDTGNVIFQGFSQKQPFEVDNVILITSGLCGSTCALFAEALQAVGVKVVTVGGRPNVGPMQGIGGVKGSQVLTFDEIALLTYNIARPIIRKDPSFEAQLPYPLNLRTEGAGINFRNSWRRDDGQYLPIEFLYTPADYRMFYTRDMFRQASAIHEAARDIAWGGAKEMSGGAYTPVMGFDGSKFKWPKGSGSTGAKGNGTSGGAAHWASLALGDLIWEKMNKHV